MEAADGGTDLAEKTAVMHETQFVSDLRMTDIVPIGERGTFERLQQEHHFRFVRAPVCGGEVFEAKRHVERFELGEDTIEGGSKGVDSRGGQTVSFYEESPERSFVQRGSAFSVLNDSVQADGEGVDGDPTGMENESASTEFRGEAGAIQDSVFGFSDCFRACSERMEKRERGGTERVWFGRGVLGFRERKRREGVYGGDAKIAGLETVPQVLELSVCQRVSKFDGMDAEGKDFIEEVVSVLVATGVPIGRNRKHTGVFPASKVFENIAVGGDFGLHIRLFEECGAGDEGVAACLSGEREGLAVDAAVDHDFEFRVSCSEKSDIGKGRIHEGLSAESGIDRHIEQFIDETVFDIGESGARFGTRIQDKAGAHTGGTDCPQRIFDIALGLHVDLEGIGTGLCEDVDIAVGLCQHEMDIAVEVRCGFCGKGNYGGTERDIGDEMSVHDIEMDGVCAGVLRPQDFRGEGAVIGRQQRRQDSKRGEHKRVWGRSKRSMLLKRERMGEGFRGPFRRLCENYVKMERGTQERTKPPEGHSDGFDVAKEAIESLLLAGDNGVLGGLAELELESLLSGELDGFLRLGIAAHASLALDNGDLTEARDCESILVLLGANIGELNEFFDSSFSLCLGDFGLFGDSGDEFRLGLDSFGSHC